MITLFSYELTQTSLLLFLLVAFLIGMAKTGIHGTGILAVPILALIFGGKDSSGLMLPMLIMADLFAVKYYHQHANWHFLRKLFPWAAIGVVIGTFVGNEIDDELFKLIMGLIIFISLGIMVWMEKADKEKIPDYLWFAILMGLLGGITTMVGNLAGAVMSLYLLSMRLPKNEYIGTAAWFYLVINLFKIPFHVFAWETISLDSLSLSVVGLPLIALGAYCGIALVKRISEQQYRWFIIAMIGVAAVFMVF